jgi:ribosomal protein S18 acetylase RimI-like enzyme
MVDMEHKIEPLEREKWQGYEAWFSDFADSCYKIEIAHEKDEFSVLMRKEPLKERKIIKYPQKLFASGYSDLKAWGVFKNGNLVAGIETGVEGWAKSPRLYISLLWVDDEYRRQGIAAALINTAKARAKKDGLRAVYLETWSCNEHAVAFYLSQGFKLIGFDTCANSNDDLEKFNVPLKLGFFL